MRPPVPTLSRCCPALSRCRYLCPAIPGGFSCVRVRAHVTGCDCIEILPSRKTQRDSGTQVTTRT